MVAASLLQRSWLLLRRWRDHGTPLLRGLDRASDYWIGYALPPAHRAIHASGWTPDARADYCRRCGGTVGPGEQRDDGCGACRGRTVPVDTIVRLGPYAAPLRDWILAIKYRERWTEMAEALGHMLAVELVRAGLVERERAIVIPMPMPWLRRFDRGIDHARSIAAGAARGLGAELITPLARREGPPQATLTRSERARRGRRDLSFDVTWRRRIERIAAGRDSGLAGIDVVLIDDVVTTGASLRAAARMLRRLRPRRVVGAVIAVSDDRARRDRLLDVPTSGPRSPSGQ